jgi:Bacterial SH3 domain
MKSHTVLSLMMVSIISLSIHKSCASSTTPSHNSPSQSTAQKGPETMTHSGDTQAASNQQEHANDTQQEIKLYPVDEGFQDRSFEIFREQLLEASRKHDSKFILSILDPDILNSYGGDGGVEEFKVLWKIDQSDSKLWSVLSNILRMGGSFENEGGEKRFCAPYVSSRWREVISQLPTNSDPLDYEAIIENNVDIRAAASSTAPVVASLSYDIVKVYAKSSVYDPTLIDSYTWLKIATVNGKEGYVSDKYTRSPSDYHACFKKRADKWVMTALVAGD